MTEFIPVNIEVLHITWKPSYFGLSRFHYWDKLISTVKCFVGFLVLGLYSLLSFDSALLNFLIALDFFVSSIAIKIIFGLTAACAVH